MFQGEELSPLYATLEGGMKALQNAEKPPPEGSGFSTLLRLYFSLAFPARLTVVQVPQPIDERS